MKNNFKLALNMVQELKTNKLTVASYIIEQNLFSKKYKFLLRDYPTIGMVKIKASIFSKYSYIEITAIGDTEACEASRDTGKILVRMNFNEYRKLDGDNTDFLKCFTEAMMQLAKSNEFIVNLNAKAEDWLE